MIYPTRSAIRSILSARGGVLGMMQTATVQLSIVFINLSTGIIAARWLGPVGRGDYAALSVWLMLPATLSVAGLQAGIIFVSRRDPDRTDAVSLAGLLCGLVAYAPVAVLSFALAPLFVQGYGVGGLIAVAICASGLNAAVMLSRQSLLGARETLLFNLSCAASPLVYLVALTVCWSVGRISLDAVFLSQITSVLVAAVIAAVFYARRRAGWRQLRVVMRPLASYSLRAAGIDLVNIVYGNADRLFLLAFVAPAELGLYAVALSFARLTSILQVAVSSVLLVDLSGKPAAEIESYIHALFLLLFWMLTTSCLLAAVLGREVLVLFFGHAFAACAPIFKVLVVESSLSCLCQVIMEAFLASEQPSYPSRVQLAYAVILLAALAALTPRFGGLGAATAMLAAAACKMAMLLAGLSRIEVALPNIGLRGYVRARRHRALFAR